MCLMCEREEMWAAYQQYVAQRAAAKGGAQDSANDVTAGAKTAAASNDAHDHAANTAAWAAGTWFEIKAQRDE